MKLAVITNILTPYRLPLFEHFAKSTKECTVLLQTEREENRAWRLPPVTFRIDVLPGFHLRPSGAEVSIHLNYGILQRLRRLQPDIVLSGGFAVANVTAYLYCKLFGKRYVQWGELTLMDGAEHSVLRRSIRRLLVGGADGYIASSQAAREAFIHYGADADAILAATMPFEAEALHERVHMWRETFRSTPAHESYARPVLMSVGQLIPRKGFEELFAIYREVNKVRPDVTLLIVGDGPCREQYEKLTRRERWAHVRFLGHLQGDDLARCFALADLFVFPTRYDAYGLVLAEAMAAELPVLSSLYAVATRDLVDEGTTGFAIEPEKTTESSNTLLKVLAMSDERRHAIGRAAYARVRSCDTGPTADRMVRFLRAIVYGVRPNGQGVAQSFQ
ncbi:MAG TPA: glycosyltransferase family 4 protein [Nitrospira sp.]|nr:glycosyltransferase family 4 protein [Nitrospira sp.]